MCFTESYAEIANRHTEHTEPPTGYTLHVTLRELDCAHDPTSRHCAARRLDAKTAETPASDRELS